MKINEEYKVTTNSKIYNYLRLLVISRKRALCPRCRPHKGCNRTRPRKIRNWKHYRKHQYLTKTIDKETVQHNYVSKLLPVLKELDSNKICPTITKLNNLFKPVGMYGEGR